MRNRAIAIVIGAFVAGAIVAVVGISVQSPSHSSSFIKKTGNQLTVDNKQFRMAGSDMPWLGLDDAALDDKGTPSYPDINKINNGFDAAVKMNANVVRSHSLGISTGNPWSVEPSLGVFNQNAFVSIDQSIRSAKEHNVRLIIPLTDMWSYKTGGKHNFTEWNGYASLKDPSGKQLDANDKSQRLVEHNFYTDQKVIESYKEYIQHVLNHKDPKTGVALKDNPTILAWETGNEVWDAPPAWTEQIAQYIKQYLGAKQLVSDGSGTSGTPDTSARLANAGAALDNPDVDILTTHFYSNIGGTSSNYAEIAGDAFFTKAAQYMNEDAAAAKAHNKAYYIGEFDWTGGPNNETWQATFNAKSLTTFTDAIANNKDVAGDMFWALYPHVDSGPAEHYDERFLMMNPPLASEPQMVEANKVLTKHASKMT